MKSFSFKLFTVSCILMAGMPLFSLSEETFYQRARISYRDHDFASTIKLLHEKSHLTLDDKKLLAQSYYYLGQYSKAKDIFKDLFDTSDPKGNDRKGILIRYFECALALLNIEVAQSLYARYVNDYRDVPSKMSYGLAKAYYDKGNYTKALPLLSRIKAGNEFFIRAQFLIGYMNLNKGSLALKIKPFKEIDQAKPLSVEDYIVKKAATLAIARIYAQNNLLDEAISFYKKVDLNAFGEDTFYEACSVMLKKADNAKYALGIYAKENAELRKFVEDESLLAAYEALQKYASSNRISLLAPKNFGLVSYLYGRSHRFEEGRESFNELLDSYHDMNEKLLLTEKQTTDSLLPLLSLETQSLKKAEIFEALIPEKLISTTHLKDLETVLSLKENILKSKQKLENLVDRLNNRVDVKELKDKQDKIEHEYKQIAHMLQNNLIAEAKKVVGEALSLASYQKAQMNYYEMMTVKKELDYVKEYRNQSVEIFNNEVKQLNKKGGSL